jgi:DNA-binding CsgD family transcriptional regulator
MMMASGDLSLAEIEGDLDLAISAARCALALTHEGVDAIALTGLLSIYSYALVLTCRYEESLKQCDALHLVAESCDLEFPVPYAQIHRARALIGLGRYAMATRTLTALERSIRDEPISYFRGAVPVQRARLYASVGDLKRALEVLSLGPAEGLNRAGRGEVLGWQALFHAAAGNAERASALARDARLASRGLEIAALSHLAEGISAIAAGNATAAVTSLGLVINNRVWDPVVVAVRAAPELGEFVADQLQWRGWLQRLLSASSDASLASKLGLPIPRAATRTQLTPRETEVHELLAQGLTNDEIAKVLYISRSTTKVHIKHIYAKLGVRSRLEAARALRSDV